MHIPDWKLCFRVLHVCQVLGLVVCTGPGPCVALGAGGRAKDLSRDKVKECLYCSDFNSVPRLLTNGQLLLTQGSFMFPRSFTRHQFSPAMGYQIGLCACLGCLQTHPASLPRIKLGCLRRSASPSVCSAFSPTLTWCSDDSW